MLLGAKFMDKNVAAVHIAEAQVELKDATRVPIVREEKSPKFSKARTYSAVAKKCVKGARTRPYS